MRLADARRSFSSGVFSISNMDNALTMLRRLTMSWLPTISQSRATSGFAVLRKSSNHVLITFPLFYLKWFVIVADINIEVVRRVEVIDHGVALVVIVGALDRVNYLGQHVERLALVMVLEPVWVDLRVVDLELTRRLLTICEHIKWRALDRAYDRHVVAHPEAKLHAQWFEYLV